MEITKEQTQTQIQLQDRKIEFTLSLNNPLNNQYELFSSMDFSAYRLSHGIKTTVPNNVYFLAIYPAFCREAKFVKYYTDQEELLQTLIAIEHIQANNISNSSELFATILAILKCKESIELYQEQKELMDMGLKHAHLDNYFQETIHNYVQDYQNYKTFCDLPFALDLFPKDINDND